MTDTLFSTTADSKDVNQNTNQGVDQTTGAGKGIAEIEEVKKQNFHAQQHIKTLETETAAYRKHIQELEERLKTSSNVDALLQRMEESTTDRTKPVDVSGLAEQVKNEVFKSLTEKQQQEIEAANVQQSIQALQKVHGDKYQEVIKARATELGMSTAQLDSIAKTSPKALLELVGVKTSGTAQPTRSTTSTTVAPSLSGEQLSSEYFMKVRKENRALWNTQEFQRKYREYLLNNVINKS